MITIRDMEQIVSGLLQSASIRCTTPVLKAGHPGVPSYYMFVCLGYGWVGYFTFLFFLISSVLCTCISMYKAGGPTCTL